MALRSMTGFARTAGAIEGYSWSWEIRSVNGRNLEVRLRLPQNLESLESKVRAMCSSRLARGNCNLTLTLRKEGGSQALKVNQTVLQQAIEIARQVRRTAGEVTAISVGDLLAVRGVLELAEAEADAELEARLNTGVLAGLEEALDILVGARAAEGRQLANVLGGLIDRVDGLVAEITDHPGRSSARIKARLERQIAALGERPEQLDPQRLAQEVLLIATRADIQEELDRLRAHVVAARALLVAGEPAGRQLDFLSQEFNREANTICSKASDIEITRLGLSLKSFIDQFREQIQNVE
ncbi:MAG: YicC family protein [Rhizobiales bacterium]|nr:YicC family protein [Hyphomicrobiales bacterium]